MPLFPLTLGFRATTFRKAFILNALVAAAIAASAISIRKAVDSSAGAPGGLPGGLEEGWRALIVVGVTVVSALLVYQAMYMFFGYGGGLLVTGRFHPALY
jgi:hypothetical protein